MKISITKYPLFFKKAAGTSRGVLHKKNTWFIKVYDDLASNEFGIGEINMFEGLSFDHRPDFYEKLLEIEKSPNAFIKNPNSLIDFPAILFGLETALLDYYKKKDRIIFPSDFTNGLKGIPINGLIWMGNHAFMLEQIKQKLTQGFRCLKMKIGAIHFDTEYEILKSIRKEFNEHELELRVDANGAFNPAEALDRLDQLSKLQLHSIEQPIKQGQWKAMEKLCKTTPLPIALDEELIGINNLDHRRELIKSIQPQYIILKPALLGGFKASEEWIKLANELNIGWWITSALESNIGLNAIAQWTFQLATDNYQGLGTGQLFTNNIASPLQIIKDELFYMQNANWDMSSL